MARISLAPPQTLGYRIGSWFSRRRYGVMLDPGAAIAHNMPVGRSCALFELRMERWRRLDRGLKDLAVMAAAARIGCAWCLDFGYWETTMKHDLPAETLRPVPDWRDRGGVTEPSGACSTSARGLPGPRPARPHGCAHGPRAPRRS